jgi:hypothetical protein
MSQLEGDFNPSFHFLGLIQKALNDGIVRRCSVAGGPPIYIVPAENAYYTAARTVEDLESLCLAAPFDLQIETVPDWGQANAQATIQIGRMWVRKQADHPARQLPSRPLTELLWYATLKASRGHLLQDCRADEMVRLKRWPDFSMLYHKENYVKLAGFMHEEAAELVTVAEVTGVPLSDVYDFHNACALLGLIERGNRFDPQEYLVGLIRKSLADGQMRRCVLAGLPPLYLAPAEDRYYSPLDLASLAPLCSAPLLDLKVDVVAGMEGEGLEEEVVQIGRMWVRRKKETPVPRMPAHPLRDLIWCAALRASRGRLLAGTGGADVVRLKRWPEVSCLSQDGRFFPLSAFMTANATTLDTVSRRTGVPLSRVIDFHNACAVLDLIERPDVEELVERPVSSRERALYRKISKGLGGIGTELHVG